MRFSPPAFATLLLAIFLSFAANAAAFTPAHGKYEGHLHGAIITFHFGAHGVSNCTYGGHTTQHGTYHSGDHSFYFKLSTSTTIQGQWTHANLVHCQVVMHKEKDSFTAHLRH